MSCLRAASALAASLDLTSVGDPVDFTIGVARKFEDYIGEELISNKEEQTESKEK